MIHKKILETISFNKIMCGRKTIEVSFTQEEYERIQIGEKIEFIDYENPYRTAIVVVEGKLQAKDMKTLTKAVSLECFGVDEEDNVDLLFSQDDQVQGVLGIRFSLDDGRDLGSITVPFKLVCEFIESSIEEIDENKHSDYRKECSEWYAWCKKDPGCTEESLSAIIRHFDDCLDRYIYEFSLNLHKRMVEMGYDKIEDFLDRPFDISDYFIVEWWNHTRRNIATLYAGLLARKVQKFQYHTVFDDSDE